MREALPSGFSDTLLGAWAVDAVERLGHGHQALGLGVERAPPGQRGGPFPRRAAPQRIGRIAQARAWGAVEEVRREVVERAIHVAERGASLRAVEGGLDDGITAG